MISVLDLQLRETEADSLLKMVCEKDSLGCDALKKRSKELSRESANSTRAHELYMAGAIGSCKQESMIDCVDLARLAERGGDIKKAKSLYWQACQISVSHKYPMWRLGCDSYAQFAKETLKDSEEEENILQFACDGGILLCEEFVEAASRNNHIGKIIEVMKRRCSAGNDDSCHDQGIALMRLKAYEEAARVFSRSCAHPNRGQECANASFCFYKLDNRRAAIKYAKRARQILSNGCNFGEDGACDVLKNLIIFQERMKE
jgi:tetratricopeptide (TPR) repeat protein